MKLLINDTEVQVRWQDNASVKALADMAGEKPVTVPMSMYGGFEQVGPLGRNLPRSDAYTETESGDIVLYEGNQIVLFYGRNAWEYTRLGHVIDRDPAGMRSLLSRGNVTVTIKK